MPAKRSHSGQGRDFGVTQGRTPLTHGSWDAHGVQGVSYEGVQGVQHLWPCSEHRGQRGGERSKEGSATACRAFPGVPGQLRRRAVPSAAASRRSSSLPCRPAALQPRRDSGSRGPRTCFRGWCSLVVDTDPGPNFGQPVRL